MIASPPRSRTTSGRFFFNRSERDLGRGRHRGDVLGHLGTFAGLGQEPGDVEIGLVPRLVVDLALHGGEAGRIAGEAPEPFGLPVGEDPAGLGGDFRRAVAVRPCGRRRLPLRSRRAMAASSESSCTSIAGPLRVRPVSLLLLVKNARHVN